MKHNTVLLKLDYVSKLRHSKNGNPRWKFLAWSVDGELREFITATDAGSGYDCDLSRIGRGCALRARYHETAKGTFIADVWEDSNALGEDLEALFVAAVQFQRGYHEIERLVQSHSQRAAI